MERSQIRELYYITPIRNVPSILRYGLLSHNQAKHLSHHSVAMEEIQKRRANKVVPGGRPLHDYVNLYFCARNPMLYSLQTQHKELCVLQISSQVLDISEVVITDGNASSEYTRFWPSSPDSLAALDYSAIFAEWWTDHVADAAITWEKKRKKCAEVLIPQKVASEYIIGAYVSCEHSKQLLQNVGFSRPITIDPCLFFQKRP